MVASLTLAHLWSCQAEESLLQSSRSSWGHPVTCPGNATPIPLTMHSWVICYMATSSASSSTSKSDKTPHRTRGLDILSFYRKSQRTHPRISESSFPLWLNFDLQEAKKKKSDNEASKFPLLPPSIGVQSLSLLLLVILQSSPHVQQCSC